MKELRGKKKLANPDNEETNVSTVTGRVSRAYLEMEAPSHFSAG